MGILNITENENSPENLRKFLESDDPAMVQMGLSMAKGIDYDVTIDEIPYLIKFMEEIENYEREAS